MQSDRLRCWLRPITRLGTVAAIVEVVLVFGCQHCFHFALSQLGIITAPPAFHAMREIAPMLGQGQRIAFHLSKFGAIAGGFAIPAIGKIALVFCAHKIRCL